jgi:TPR repeat protein
MLKSLNVNNHDERAGFGDISSPMASPMAPTPKDQKNLLGKKHSLSQKFLTAIRAAPSNSAGDASSTRSRSMSNLNVKFNKFLNMLPIRRHDPQDFEDGSPHVIDPTAEAAYPDYVLEILYDARKLNCVESQFTMGYIFDVGGKGVDVNTNEAIYWYTRAADRGHIIAQNNLGVLYSTAHQGRMPKKNPAEALHWYMKAAKEGGNANAQFHVGLAYMNGDGVAEKDDQTAFMYFKKAGKQGHVLAMSNVGAMYLGGRGIAQNHKKAFKWLKKVVNSFEENKEDAVAHHNIGMMYMKGLGVLQDVEKGEEYIRKAMSRKNAGYISEALSKQSLANGSALYNS